MLDWNTWNHLTVCQQMIKIKIISIRLEYLKPFNCVYANKWLRLELLVLDWNT